MNERVRAREQEKPCNSEKERSIKYLNWHRMQMGKCPIKLIARLIQFITLEPENEKGRENRAKVCLLQSLVCEIVCLAVFGF